MMIVPQLEGARSVGQPDCFNQENWKMTTLILPTNPTRAYISFPHCRRHEVIVRDSYITPKAS